MKKGKIVLSDRLKAVVSMVTGREVICDVGCDHGFVSIELIRMGICPRVIAMDVNSGPLQAARENILLYGLEAYIETRLSDGLKQLEPGEAGGLICAGMGGGLICKILGEGEEKAAAMKELILQPQSQLEETRAYLGSRGFLIEEEKMVFEDGKYYPIIRVVPTNERISYSPLENRYGPILIRRKDPVLIRFLLRERDICNEILANLRQAQMREHSDPEKRKGRNEQVLKTIREIDLTLEKMEALEDGGSNHV